MYTEMYLAESCHFVLKGCPCGYLTDPRHRCRCSPAKVQTYLAKISGPLLDRIDLHVEVPAVPVTALTQAAAGEPSVRIKARIVRARRRQRTRLKPSGLFANSQMRHRETRKLCVLSDAAQALLKQAMDELHFSARTYDKILKISRTIADLAEHDNSA